jgi:hypothetical protein
MTLGRRKYAQGISYNTNLRLGFAEYGCIAMIIPLFMMGVVLIELG